MANRRMAGQKVVLVLGAGATIADCLRKSDIQKPPLDKGFFKAALRSSQGAILAPVVEYMQAYYRTDVTDTRQDSLERVMAVLYTDVHGGPLEDEAYGGFLALVKAFLARLAETTNPVRMTQMTRLYRLIAYFLDSGVHPNDLTIVTFNQDIQIEKALDAIRRTKGRRGAVLFRFPGCYRMEIKGTVTRPRDSADIFVLNHSHEGVSLLKLHGSLNWYSRHNSRDPRRTALFNDDRVIGMTRRKEINPAMTVDVGGRARFTFPVVVPPVVHKSQVLHSNLKPVWDLAEQSLTVADRIVIFGYSCPPNDWESANLISRALTANGIIKELSIIDPDAAVVLRYAELGSLRSANYFRYCDNYLTSE